MMRKKGAKKIKGFSMQFLLHSEIVNLNSDERIKKILKIVLANKILVLQGKLKAQEETRLIGDTMAMAGFVKGFKGIELAVISGNNSKNKNLFSKFRNAFIKALARGDLGTITIIGPATIVKEIKRDPSKIEVMLS